MRLRPYQQEAYDNTISLWNKGTQNVLIVLPTGTGKTIVFSHLIKHMSTYGRVLVLADRDTLVWQAKDKIERITGLICDVEMAEYRSNETSMFSKAPVVVSTRQTQMTGRMNRFHPEDFSLVVIDEAHHAPAHSYRTILDYYGQNPDLRALGVTATPDRADEESLGQIFSDYAIDYELPDAVRDGWLVVPTRIPVPVVDMDLSSLHTQAGDFHRGELSELLEQDALVDCMCSKTAELVGHRKALVFCESVDQSKLWAAKLSDLHGISAIEISGNTDKDNRQKLLADYRAGKHTCLCNVAIATEGFDVPNIEIIVMARPTKSRSLYAQMLGRGTRPAESIADTLGTIQSADERRALIESSEKPSMLIVDFVGNTGRHQVISAVDILGGKHSDPVIERAKEIMDRDETEQTVDDAIERAEEELLEEKRKAEAEQYKKRAKVRAKAKYAQGVIENLFDVMGCQPVREKAYNRGRKPTVRMKALLEKNGLWNKDLTFTQAHQLIDRIMDRRKKGLCTPKQAKRLQQFGYSPNTRFEDAHKLLDAIAANGWRRPAYDPV